VAEIRAGRYRLTLLGWYELKGMRPYMYDVRHPLYGKPSKLCCRYLGPRSGERRWHVFEVWVDGREQGVVVMNEADLGQLIVTAAEPAKGARG